MENLNLKAEILKYYFPSIKNLTKKTIIQGTLKKIIIKILPKTLPSYQCYHTILPLGPLLIKEHYVKVHGVHIH